MGYGAAAPRALMKQAGASIAPCNVIGGELLSSSCPIWSYPGECRVRLPGEGAPLCPVGHIAATHDSINRIDFS